MNIRPASSKQFFVTYKDSDGTGGVQDVWSDNPGHAMRLVHVGQEGRRITGCRRNGMNYDDIIGCFNDPFYITHHNKPQQINQEEFPI